MVSFTEFICCGAPKKVESGLVKKPVSRCLTAITTSKVVFALTVSKFLGVTNFEEGMFVVGAITPIGAVLHEPVLIC